MLFLDASWTAFGSKAQLSAVIHRATGVPEWYLHRPDQIPFASVAARMAWAARRQTTRSEDIAYSLLGLFNVNSKYLLELTISGCGVRTATGYRIATISLHETFSYLLSSSSASFIR